MKNVLKYELKILLNNQDYYTKLVLLKIFCEKQSIVFLYQNITSVKNDAKGMINVQNNYQIIKVGFPS